jgi:Na+-driven multidrug efflux pump
MPALGIYNWGNAVLSAAGNTKKPLYFLTISGVINIILNLFFVIICHLSVAGVALASVISQYALAVMIIVTMLKEKQDFRLEIKKIRITKSKVPTITKLGILSGFQSAVFHFANLFVQAGVNSFDAILVSGNSAATNADSIIFESIAAFNTAGATFIGQNYGARDKKRMRTSYLTSLFLSMGLGLLLGSLLLVLGREFLSLFSSEPAVIDAGLKRLNIMALCYFLSALMDCTIAASRAIHKTGVPTFIVIMGSCVFRVLWVKTVFAIIGTIPSLYLLYPFSFVITGVAEIAYFIYSFKRISFKEGLQSNSHKSSFDMNGKPYFKEHLT